MDDRTASDGFEEAFGKAAERHERAWIFFAALLLSLLVIGSMFFVVLDYGVVVKTAGFSRDAAAPADPGPDSGLVRTGPNAYSVHMLGHLWAWTPSPLNVPQGASVTFYVSSSDLVHGFEVQGTTINVTAVPGVTGSVTYTFRHPGTYYMLCNEFCGIEHQAMIGRIIVHAAEAK
jgi:cytochrome c oxidase subunit II